MNPPEVPEDWIMVAPVGTPLESMISALYTDEVDGENVKQGLVSVTYMRPDIYGHFSRSARVLMSGPA